MFRMTVTGDKDLVRTMHSLGRRVSGDVQRKAVRAASFPILTAFRAAAPVGKTGRLKRAQTRKFKTYRGSGTSIAIVGSDYWIAPHHHLVELGTVERYRKKFASRPGRGATGRMPAQHVFEKAYLGVKAYAELVLEQAIKRGIFEATNGQ